MKHRIVLLAATAAFAVAGLAALPAGAGAKPAPICVETTQFIVCTP